MELGERKQKILTLIIEDYIRTGEPTSSRLLTEQLSHTVSSATIRNEMAELAALGFLEQPHTSAGRVPTGKAFRLYLDKLMKKRPLPEESRRDIAGVLLQASDPEQLMERASQLLSEGTGYTAVTTTPKPRGAVIRRIELLQTSPHSVALLLITGSGGLRSRSCRLPDGGEAEQIAKVGNLLRETFAGKPLSGIGLPQVQGLLTSLPFDGLRCLPILTAFYELVCEAAEAEILLKGELNILQYPDYAWENARALLRFLSQREEVGSMLAAHSGGLRVVLGSESPRPELSGSSIIVTRYRQSGGADGTMGLIGPLRMDYVSAISRLEYVAGMVAAMLEQLIDD